jgi:NADH:ubiquinone reductase (H+-translocating)
MPLKSAAAFCWLSNLAERQAERQNKTADGQSAISAAVCGRRSGPTGVELAGTLAEIAHHALNGEFRHIDPRQSRILLIEGGPRVLPAYSEELSRKAEAQLHTWAWRFAPLTWSRASSPARFGRADRKDSRPGRLVGRGRRRFAAGPKVGRSRRPRRPRAGAARPQHSRTRGSLRDWRPRALNDENGKMLPGVAQVAIQQGDWVAETIARDLQNQPRRNFHYHDKGSLATIGRAAAVAQFGKFEMSGYFAWLAWLFIHILF